MLHKLRNEIKANAKSVYPNLRGGAHGHISLLTTYEKYFLILNTPFIKPNHPGSIIIMYGTNFHMKSNMRITHNEEVRLFRKVTGVKQALIQNTLSTVEEDYLENIRNRTMNSINDTMGNLLTHMQENYRQLIRH